MASRGPSAPRGVARSLCTTWRRVVRLHAVALRGPSEQRDVAVPLHDVASSRLSASRGVARSLRTIWRRAVSLRGAANTQQLWRQNFCSQSSCVILASPTDCTYDSRRDTSFGKHEHGALWLLICGAIDGHLLIYLLAMHDNVASRDPSAQRGAL